MGVPGVFKAEDATDDSFVAAKSQKFRFQYGTKKLINVAKVMQGGGLHQ